MSNQTSTEPSVAQALNGVNATKVVGSDLVATASKAAFVAIGQLAVVMARSLEHQQVRLADIQTLLLPPVLSGQYAIATDNKTATGVTIPVAAVLWAHVSPDVDRRLSLANEPPKLLRQDWTSGAIPWLIDAFGEPRASSRLLGTVLQARFARSGLRAMLRNPDGSYRMEVLAHKTATPEHQRASSG